MLPSSNQPGAPNASGAPRPGSNSPFQRVMGPKGGPKGAGRDLQGPFLKRVLTPVVGALTNQSSLLMKNVDIDDIRFRLMRAGFPANLKAHSFILLKWFLLATLAFLFPLIAPVYADLFGWHFGPTAMIIIAILGGWAGWKVPDIWLSMKTRQRQFAIQMVMPDMIDLITVSVEAGLGLYAAIQRISDRFPNPLSEEFSRAMQEVRLGRTNSQALRDLAHRVDLPDLTTLITALVQAEQLGIAVANVLRIQSERLREIRSARAREQAQKAPIKLMFPLVLFIFPALFIVILGPALIRVIETGF